MLLFSSMGLARVVATAALLLGLATQNTTAQEADSTYYLYEKNDSTLVSSHVEMEGSEVTAKRLSIEEEVSMNVYGQDFGSRVQGQIGVNRSNGGGRTANSQGRSRTNHII